MHTYYLKYSGVTVFERSGKKVGRKRKVAINVILSLPHLVFFCRFYQNNIPRENKVKTGKAFKPPTKKKNAQHLSCSLPLPYITPLLLTAGYFGWRITGTVANHPVNYCFYTLLYPVSPSLSQGFTQTIFFSSICAFTNAEAGLWGLQKRGVPVCILLNLLLFLLLFFIRMDRGTAQAKTCWKVQTNRRQCVLRSHHHHFILGTP